ncbi:MAG TPA: DUF2993 domain-containing protein, partial [Actinomycetota bacterium]|nr:DUF2993 domain-containing protein [Actinomycetota bacterium]
MKTLVALVVVAILLVAGDAAARSYASSELEAQLTSALRLEGQPRVDIDGFPFIVRLVQGSFDEVQISARGVRSPEIELSRAKVTLNDVRFSTSKALSGDLRAIDF